MAALEAVRAFRADARNASRERDASALESRLTRLNGSLGSLYRIVEGADVGPTSQVMEAIGATARELDAVLAEWADLRR